MPAITVQQPIRTMVFSAHVAGRSRSSMEALGANGGEATQTGQRMSSYSGIGHVDTDVRIRVNILAATDDGGLVADISEDGHDRTAPKTRVGITKDGEVVVMDPGASLFDEESGLLMMLARNFVSGHDSSNGASWTLPFGSSKGTLNIRVTSDDDTHVSLALHGESADASGATREQLQGTVLYDTSRTTPIKATLTTATETLAAATTSHENMTVDYTLQSDTLAGK
jgi:hypothetical protein